MKKIILGILATAIFLSSSYVFAKLKPVSVGIFTGTYFSPSHIKQLVIMSGAKSTEFKISDFKYISIFDINELKFEKQVEENFTTYYIPDTLRNSYINVFLIKNDGEILYCKSYYEEDDHLKFKAQSKMYIGLYEADNTSSGDVSACDAAFYPVRVPHSLHKKII